MWGQGWPGRSFGFLIKMETLTPRTSRLTPVRGKPPRLTGHPSPFGLELMAERSGRRGRLQGPAESKTLLFKNPILKSYFYKNNNLLIFWQIVKILRFYLMP